MKLNSHQYEFISSKAKHPALVAGFGSGKTIVFCLKGLIEAGLNPGKTILLAEPVYPMVKNVLQPTLEHVMKDYGFDYSYKASDYRYRVSWDGGWADILLGSAENYQRWAGLNLAAGGIDEAALLKDNGAWNMLLSRLRDGNTLTGWATTTPEGFNWVYDTWVEEIKYGYELIQGRTEDNSHLPDEFIESLKTNYDDRLIKAYMNGEFVNLQHGQTYYQFNRDKNVQAKLVVPHLPIRAAIDFNVDPMAVSVGQLMPGKKPQVNWLKTYKIKHSGSDEVMTETAARRIKADYPGTRVIAYPDPAGKHRDTRSNRSDHQILRDEGFEVRAKSSTRSVSEGVNAVNRGMAFTTIHPECKPLIKDLEQVINKDGTREIDKSNKALTHYSDGIRYFYDYEFPVKKPNHGSVKRW